MTKENKHYVVMCDWSATIDGMINGNVDIAGIAHSLEEAKEILAKVSIDEKQYAQENQWIVYEDSDVEFDAGEIDYYAAEHVHFYIQEVE